MSGLLIPALTVWLAAAIGADLASVLAERNPERRARKALDNAALALKAARQAYLQGEASALRSALDEVRESVEVAYRSLKETGRDPLRHPRPFKDAEIKTRDLLKRISHLRDEMAYQDRELIEPLLDRVAQIHEDLLLSVMGKKSRR